MMKIVVLTSKKNFVWKSMEEIIPFIEDSWLALSSDKFEVKCLNIDNVKMKKLLVDIIDASHLVLSCFTPEIFQFVNFIRSEMSLNHRFIIYLHNQATIACWPMLQWGSPSLFKKNDLFVSSCERDAECLKISFPEASIKVIPFSYKNISTNFKIPKLLKTEVVDLFFAGRLSSQKNLHLLIVSLHLLKKNFPHLKWKMHFYGSPDNLGSPNMGWADHNYIQTLNSITHHYGLDEELVFHGFVERNKLSEVINSSKKIFIAPSLHSDENFGMVAFNSLINGHLAVLSDWGGHSDLKKNFKDLVTLTDVYQSSQGPFINPMDLALKIKYALENYSHISSTTEVPACYSFENITSLNLKLINESLDKEDTKDQLLRPSSLAEEVLKRAQKNERQIFFGYNDPLSHPFLKAYGMTSSPKEVLLNREQISSYPWVNVTQDQLVIDDPHRGKLIFSNQEAITLSWRLANGFAYKASND